MCFGWSMTDERQDREDTERAWQAWLDAEKAYRDQQDRHVAFWWEDDPSANWTMPEGVDPEALERLAELRAEAQRAHDAYIAARDAL